MKGQKSLYKHLNDRRVRALLGARGSDKRKSFVVGQFVTISNENYAGTLIDKTYSPRNMNIFKISAINKDGFSCTVINVLTGASHEVVHSRIQPLSLIDLEKAHFGTPELYKN